MQTRCRERDHQQNWVCKVCGDENLRKEQCHPNVTAEVLPKKSADLHKLLMEGY
jgi:hypothetical protein